MTLSDTATRPLRLTVLIADPQNIGVEKFRGKYSLRSFRQKKSSVRLREKFGREKLVRKSELKIFRF